MHDIEEQLAHAGFGIIFCLTIILCTLKLIGYISISWFWVFSPVILPLSGFVCFLIILIILTSLVSRGKDWDKNE